MADKIPVIFEFSAHSTGKMRNEIDVWMAQPPNEEEWQIATDEGDFHGGDGTAPPPLALFAAAVAACMMTQIRGFSKRMGIPIRGVQVTGRTSWKLHPEDRVYSTEPDRFELDFDIDSDEPRERIEELMRQAQKGCFIDQTLQRQNAVVHRLRVGDDVVEIERDPESTPPSVDG